VREPELETIEGVLGQIVFASSETGFSVVRVEVQGEPSMTAVGNLLGARVGEVLRLTGRWVDDRKYGRQFKVDAFIAVMPSTLEGIQRYLASGMVEGIGAEIAKRLVQHFGHETLDVIERKPDRLREVEGIGRVRAQRIRDAWLAHAEVKEVMIFLHGCGLSTGYAAKIYKQYGQRAVGLIRENPYRLALDIFGIGFQKADHVARTLGFEMESKERAEAGTLHVLFETTEEGHVFVPREELVARAKQMLGVDPILVESAVEKLAADGRIRIDADRIYLVALFHAEVSTADGLRALLRGPSRSIGGDPSVILSAVEQETGIELAAEQRAAVVAAMTKRLVVVTGGPGTGKTTIVRAIIRALESAKRRVLLAAPTGRAAKRLSEATSREAKTIHRLLEFDPKARTFGRNADHPLDADALIIDESSMVDILLVANVVAALPARASLVLVGDADQLPSVGPGAVLDDVIASDRAEVIELRQIFRQAERSAIVVNAHRINAGALPILEAGEEKQDFYLIEREEPERVLQTIQEVVKNRIPQSFGLDPIDDIQVLTPMHKGTLGAENLNAQLQALLNPGEGGIARGGHRFRAGDKVMQTKNDYTLGVFNGDLGRVVAIDEEERTVTARFDDRLVELGPSDLETIVLAYACSIHKAQGSEYPAVVVPVSTQHYVMLHRNLLYTAVTRGRRLVVLIGSQRALRIAVANAEHAHRHTGLAGRLRG
jgi:exodeoxyribonuclease V alpha subunit